MKTTEQRLEELAGPGVAVLTIPQLAHAIGLNGPGAVQSIRNRIARETFPIPSKKRGKERIFSIRRVAEWLDGIDEPEPNGLPAVRQYKNGALVSVNGRPVRQKRLAYVGAVYGRLITDALDDWLREHQARLAGTLGAAVDSAIAEPLPSYDRKRSTP